jgi:hypothetical protein
VESWQQLGLPQIVQFDNEMVFSGGRWAHRLGRIVRLCLALGVQVWFIPFYTPQRNGYVESFHSQTDQFFWSRTQFENRLPVEASYPDFLTYFRQQRQLPAIQEHTPAQKRASYTDTPVHLLPPEFDLHQRTHLPLVNGTVYCVRLANHLAQVNILNHHITLDRAYAHHYILAQINTETQQMTLFHQPNATVDPLEIKVFPFPLLESPLDFKPDFDYPAAPI